jgi:hypothetical protein
MARFRSLFDLDEASSSVSASTAEAWESLDNAYRMFLEGCAPYRFPEPWSALATPTTAWMTSDSITETFNELPEHFSRELLLQSGLFVAADDGRLESCASLSVPGRPCLTLSSRSDEMDNLLTATGCVRDGRSSLLSVATDVENLALVGRSGVLVLTSCVDDVIIYRCLGIAAAPLPDSEHLNADFAQAVLSAISLGGGIPQSSGARNSGRAPKGLDGQRSTQSIAVCIALGSISAEFVQVASARSTAKFSAQLAEYYNSRFAEVSVWIPDDGIREQIALLRRIGAWSELSRAISRSLSEDAKLLGALQHRRNLRKRSLARPVNGINDGISTADDAGDNMVKLLEPLRRVAQLAENPIDGFIFHDLANKAEILIEQMTSLREELRHRGPQNYASIKSKIDQYLRTSSSLLHETRLTQNRWHHISISARTQSPNSPYDFLG